MQSIKKFKKTDRYLWVFENESGDFVKCIECMRDIPEETVVCPYCDTNQILDTIHTPTSLRTKWAITGAFFAFLLAIFSWVSIYFLWVAGFLGTVTLLDTYVAHAKKRERFAKVGVFLSIVSLVFVTVFLVGWILEARHIQYKARIIGEEIGVELIDKGPVDRNSNHSAIEGTWEEVLLYRYKENEILQMNQEIANNILWIQTEFSSDELAFLEKFSSVDIGKLTQEGSAYVVYDRTTNAFAFPTSLYKYDFVLVVYQSNPIDEIHLVIYAFAKNTVDTE
jgi:hypothetical protein